MPPQISVVTPGRFRLDTIERCVASVQAQQDVEVEHILVSDSSREFFEAAASLAARYDGVSAHLLPDTDPPLTYLPSRLARVRNFGVTHARGGYVAFLDDDNTWEPDHLAALLGVLIRDPGLGAAFSHRALWNADGSPYLEARHPWNNARTADRYQELRDLGMYVPGTNLVHDQTWVSRPNADGRLAPFLLCSVDASAWLLRIEVARAHPFRTAFTADEMQRREAEDTALCFALCNAGVRVASSERYSLNYFLGGFSTTAGAAWQREA